MKMLSIREAREMLGKVDSLLKQGSNFIITRHGKPVARIIPYHDWEQTSKRRDVLRASLPKMKVSSTGLIRAAREGHRS